MVDNFDAERAAQRKEFFKREQKPPKSHHQFRPKKQHKVKPKPMTFEQKLSLTEQWLEEIFPHLFAADDYIPLDHHLLRDLKTEYKNNALKKSYHAGLVIKAALSRYKETYGYLHCIKEGAHRYNIKDEFCGIVTKEEEEEARRILDTL